MKKKIIMISVLIIIFSVFVSCSTNSSSEDISTTAITDSDGVTHYYEIVSNNSETAILYEIETQSKGTVITKKEGKYVTNKHTTFHKIRDSLVEKENKTKESSLDDKSKADNYVEFESPSDDTTNNTTKNKTISESTTKKESHPATDKDGWINKWY